MTLSTQVGSFFTGTAAATNTVAVTGVGFQPKVVIFWSSGTASSVDVFAGTNNRRMLGVATSSTSRWVVGTQSEDGVSVSNTDRIHREDACLATLTSAGAVDGLMDFQSMDADGFTLVVDDAFAATVRIQYLALGGADLTDVATGRFDEPAATGNQDITSVGFQPDLVMFGSIGIATDPPAVSTTSILMIGAAASASQQAVLTNTAINSAATMDTSAYSLAGECIATGTSSAGIVRRASFDSFLSNGFRLNWAERFADMVVFYLALRGGSYRVDNLLTSTSNGATITETGFGFAPKATMLFSHGRAADTSDAITDSDQWNVGAFTSTTNRGAGGMLDEDNSGSSDIEIYIEYDAALAQVTIAPALVGLVDVQSIDADGFTLVMDSAASPAAFVWYVSFGDTPGAAAENPYPYVGGGYYPTEG